MSNLGYWQLKASPGIWQVALAPGPSSEVYEVRADPNLLPQGHSAVAARKVGVDVAKSVPLPKLRLLLGGFSGEHRPSEEAPTRDHRSSHL